MNVKDPFQISQIVHPNAFRFLYPECKYIILNLKDTNYILYRPIPPVRNEAVW